MELLRGDDMTDDLLIKYLLQETDQQENQLIEKWLLEPENKKHFNHFEQIWEKSKLAGLESSTDENRAWERFKVLRANSEKAALKTSASVTQKLFSSVWFKVAAVFLLVGGFWYTYSLNNTAYQQLSAGAQVVSKVLPDGSEITLNKNSDLSYSGNFKNNRNVRLNEGEVFFKVTHDKSHPFIIDADDVRIRVVGTAFNVKHRSNGTEVIVESGIVRVSHGGGFITLHQGEKVIISPNQEGMQKAAVNNQLYDYYRTKVFSANNTSLKDLIAVLNDAYQADIVIPDPQVQALTITTTFKAKQLDDILQIIAATHRLQISRKGKQVLLTR